MQDVKNIINDVKSLVEMEGVSSEVILNEVYNRMLQLENIIDELEEAH